MEQFNIDLPLDIIIWKNILLIVTWGLIFCPLIVGYKYFRSTVKIKVNNKTLSLKLYSKEFASKRRPSVYIHKDISGTEMFALQYHLFKYTLTPSSGFEFVNRSEKPQYLSKNSILRIVDSDSNETTIVRV